MSSSGCQLSFIFIPPKRITDVAAPRSRPRGLCDASARKERRMHRVFVSSIRRSRSGFGLTDLLVVVALIPLVAVLVAGCVRRTRGEGAVRVYCASHLRQIGQAILLYSNENRGAYPRTKYVGGKPPTWGTHAPATQPFSDVAPDDNDVTAA